MRPIPRALRSAAPAVALGVALGVALASCALAGFDVLDEVTASADAGATTSTSTSTSSTSTSTTSTGAGGQGGAPCGLASFPGPPSVATPEGSTEFVVAIRKIDFGDKSKTLPGLDLDGKCTCTAGKIPKGCCQSDGPSCKMATTACDGPRGVDNAGASVFQLISTFLGNFGSDFYSKRAELGEWSTLFRVRGYNGQSNDDRVELDWYASAGLEQPDGGLPDAAAATPKWEGHDRWRVTEDSVLPPDGGPPSLDQPRWSDKKAYVTDNVLVASIPSSVLRLAGLTNAMDVRVSAGFIVAEIAPQAAGDGYALTKGLIVFRWKTKDVFYALSSYRDEVGNPICTDSPFYKTGVSQLCSLPDITVEAVAPTEACTALSVGIGFEASPAEIGVFTPSAGNSPGCPAATDPANDDCPPIP